MGGGAWWLVMSLIVKAVSDSEDVGRAFVRADDGSQGFHLFEVSKVFDPVGAAGGRGQDVPLHGGVTPIVWTLQPVKPAARDDIDEPLTSASHGLILLLTRFYN